MTTDTALADRLEASARWSDQAAEAAEIVATHFRPRFEAEEGENRLDLYVNVIENEWTVKRLREEAETFRQAATALRSAGWERWKCAARTGNTGANAPQECDWPVCGCDPHADKVIASLQETGALRSAGAVREEAAREAYKQAAIIVATSPADLPRHKLSARLRALSNGATVVDEIERLRTKFEAVLKRAQRAEKERAHANKMFEQERAENDRLRSQPTYRQGVEAGLEAAARIAERFGSERAPAADSNATRVLHAVNGRDVAKAIRRALLDKEA